MEEPNFGEIDLKRLNDAINAKYNYDFSNYASSSYSRRVTRIIQHYQLKDIDVLRRKVVEDNDFFMEFVRAITVNTTEMFRDPAFWTALRDDVLPSIAKHDVIRIWHAGCSTGEEIYSMAIILKEYGIYDKCKIFATDINDSVIKVARQGKYHVRNLDRDSKNYEQFGGKAKLSNYFAVDGDYLTMDPSLFANVTTKRHDLVKSDIFSKFDLILCRNVIIYFNKNLQDEVFNLFIRSLYTGGHLAIGSKESLIWSSSAHRFKSINPDNNIYSIQ